MGKRDSEGKSPDLEFETESSRTTTVNSLFTSDWWGWQLRAANTRVSFRCTLSCYTSKIDALDGAPWVAHLTRPKAISAGLPLAHAPTKNAPSVRNARLAQEDLVHVDGGLEAVLLEELDLADLLEDEGLARLVALDLETSAVVSAVLHALEALEEGVEDRTTVLEKGKHEGETLAEGLRGGRGHGRVRRGKTRMQRCRTWRMYKRQVRWLSQSCLPAEKEGG